ncbi:MAG: Ig-like domain-containing protein [Lachnospiraceae bacterium]|nr:Ig-like domain-containing protein [Lachnospiraceae bacterium]
MRLHYKRGIVFLILAFFLPFVLQEGTVTAAGAKVDTSNGTKLAVTISSDIRGILDKGTKGAVSYLQEEYPETFQYGYEWILYTLLRSGETVSQAQINSYYYAAVSEIKKWDSSKKPTDIERTALAFSILGKDITNIEGVNLAAMIYNSPKLDSGSNELIYALLALDAGKTEIPVGAKWSREQMITKLLMYQNENGGFGLTDNKTTSVDVTAMALQALAGYEKTDEEAGDAVAKGIAYLQNVQQADCGFGSPEATAQVLLALTALDKDVLDEEEGFCDAYQNIITNLNQYYLEQPAGFVHALGEKKPDSMVTIQVLQAYTAYRRYQAGSSSYWDLTDRKGVDLVKPLSIAFEKNSYTIYATEKLTLKIQCEDTKDWIVKYTSSNPEILAISQQGVIEGKRAGTVKITAQSAGGASATVLVYVKTPKVKLSVTKGKLQVKKSTTALKVVEKLDTDKVSKWESSKKRIVTVDKKGKLTAKRTGTATITVIMKSGATAKCKVTVQKKPVKNGVRFKKSSYKLYVAETLGTRCTLLNTFDAVKGYSSSNKKVVTVSKKGVLKGIKPGKARITVKTKNGAKATVKVVVKKPSTKT